MSQEINDREPALYHICDLLDWAWCTQLVDALRQHQSAIEEVLYPAVHTGFPSYILLLRRLGRSATLAFILYCTVFMSDDLVGACT